MTTSYFSPSAASRGSSSSTFATRNFTVSERLFLFAFSVACLTAYSDISSPVTSLAPAIPALRANVHVREAVEHSFPLADTLHSKPVILLV